MKEAASSSLPQQEDTIPYAVKNLSLALLKIDKGFPETC
jgi:hypothetical protein